MPQRQSARLILVAALLLSPTPAKGADAPAPRPVVPALTTEPDGRTSFLVTGVYRQSESGLRTCGDIPPLPPGEGGGEGMLESAMRQ